MSLLVTIVDKVKSKELLELIGVQNSGKLILTEEPVIERVEKKIMTKERFEQIKQWRATFKPNSEWECAMDDLINYVEELEKERDYLNDAVNGLDSNLNDAISGKFFKGSR